jgi:hypothetical protein
MPRFRVGGQFSFEADVRAKDIRDAQDKAIRKAWREGSIYLDESCVRRIVRRNGEDVVLEEGE